MPISGAGFGPDTTGRSSSADALLSWTFPPLTPPRFCKMRGGIFDYVKWRIVMTDDPQELYGIAQIETALAGIEAVENANNVAILQVRSSLSSLQTKVDILMSAQTAVQADIVSMQASLATIATDITAITAMLGAITVSPADQANLDSVTASLASVATQLTSLANPVQTPTPTPDQAA